MNPRGLQFATALMGLVSGMFLLMEGGNTLGLIAEDPALKHPMMFGFWIFLGAGLLNVLSYVLVPQRLPFTSELAAVLGIGATVAWWSEYYTIALWITAPAFVSFLAVILIVIMRDDEPAGINTTRKGNGS